MNSPLVPEYVFREAALDAFPKADAGSFAIYTDELKAAGFDHVGDYAAGRPDKPGTEMFVRLFAHPVYNCFMELYQIFVEGEPTCAARYVASSILDAGWELCTTGHAPSPLVSMMISRPGNAWTSHEGATTFEVLHLHLKTRQRLATRRRLSVATDMSFAAYLAKQQKSHREQWLWLHGTPQEVIERELFGHPRTCWMGE